MKNRAQVVVYGISLGLLAVLLKVVEYRFVVYDHAFEIYAGVVALTFAALGVWFGMKLKARRAAIKLPDSAPQSFRVDPTLLDELGISKREFEVLELIANGLSTKEIGEKLFISRNTVKTHASSLFQKLNAKRRTQAVRKAKSLGLLP